jgi:hypothetical protein
MVQCGLKIREKIGNFFIKKVYIWPSLDMTNLNSNCTGYNLKKARFPRQDSMLLYWSKA